MSELNYKASNIAKAERENKKRFFDTFNELENGLPSFDSILFMLRAGGLSEEEADAMLEDKGIAESLALVVEAVTDAGFLGKVKVDTNKMRLEMNQAIKAEDSPTSGESKKA